VKKEGGSGSIHFSEQGRMRSLSAPTVGFLCLLIVVGVAAQTGPPRQASSVQQDNSTSTTETSKLSSTKALEREFFTLLRAGDPQKLLDYISDGGVNVGPNAQHVTRKEVEQQLIQHEGIYCELFDSACIRSQIKLDDSGIRQCSYRELLTSSANVRTAATDTTRNGVRQAILVAQVKNDSCAGVGLIDFIFNAQSDGWKLFSIP